MNKHTLIEAAMSKATYGGGQVSAEQVESIVDALFGTVERPGAIAEGLRNGERVTIMGFGDFHLEGAEPALRPGEALNQYVRGSVG